MSNHYNTQVVMYKGVPFGPDYNHTIEPANYINKLNCLDANYLHDSYTELQTIHMNSETDVGKMRLVVKSVDAYAYNYAMIDDLEHGLRFFAFITGCKYINDANSDPNGHFSTYKCVFEFTFMKDLLMTYLDTGTVHAAPILRHTATSRFNNGYHTEPINLQTVDYSIAKTNVAMGYTSPSSQTLTVLWCSFNWDQSTDPDLIPDSTLNGVLNCVLGMVYKSTSDVKSDLRTLSQQPGFELLGVTTMPNFMFNWDAAPALSSLTGKPLVDRYVTDTHSFTIPSKSHYKSVSEGNAGITCKNKKCFYFPFAKFVMESNAGSIIELQPEYLNKTSGTGGVIRFDLTANVGRPTSYTVEPREYGAITAHSPNINCSTSSFPEGCATLDSYAMYLNQRYKFPDSPIGIIGQHFVEAVPGIMGGAASMAMGNMVSVGTETAEGSGLFEHSAGSRAGAAGIGGAISSAGQALFTAEAMQRKSDAVIGAVPSPDTDFIRNNIDVLIKYTAVHPKELAGLDDYFEKFGYSQGGEIEVPDLAGRDRYVYCQTGGMCFRSSNCNATENARINNIFMGGVTFWKRTAINDHGGDLVYGSNGTDPIDDAM